MGGVAGELPSTPSEVITPDDPEGWEALYPSNVQKSFKKAIGQGPNEAIARKHMAEADDLFRQKQYAAAGKQYKSAAGRWPDSALEEDAMFLRGECYFFDDRYADANDMYDDVVKRYSNSRHLDKIVVRQFAIARYWQESEQLNPHFPVTPNLTDKTRPWFDT